MEERTVILEALIGKAETYAKTNVELFKLKAIDKSADVVSTLASRMVLAIVVLFIVISVNIGLALWLGEGMGKIYYGFFVVAGFYTLLAFILHYFRIKLIKAPVFEAFVTMMMKENKR